MNDKRIVKKPDELVKMKGEFSESALKLSAYIISQLEKDKLIYRINVNDYFQKYDKRVGDFKYLYNIAIELTKKQFRMQNRKTNRFSVWNFISNADYYDGILEIEFSYKTLTYLLEIKDKYLKYDLKNIMLLNSKYSIRMYEILKNKLQQNNRYGKETKFSLNVDWLREALALSETYPYGMFKKRVLEVSKEELNKKTDLEYDYVEEKKGRKVVAITFNVVAKEEEKQISFKEFVAMVREKYSGNKTYFAFKHFDNKRYWIGVCNKGLLYAVDENGEIRDLNSKESLNIYKTWFNIFIYSKTYQELFTSSKCLKVKKNSNKSIWNSILENIISLKEQGII